MMPEIDGIEACQIIRSDVKVKQPIITFLTSRSEDYSQIAGFEAGADDYIAKPIRPRLLISKVESLLRRYSSETMGTKAGSIQIDREKFIVYSKGYELVIPTRTD